MKKIKKDNTRQSKRAINPKDSGEGVHKHGRPIVPNTTTDDHNSALTRLELESILASHFGIKGSHLFLADEFGGTLTPHNLIEAIKALGIEVPEAATEIESLNHLLRGGSLFSGFKGIPLPGKAKLLPTFAWVFGDSGRIRSNRLILETAFPDACPKKDAKLSLEDPELPFVIQHEIEARLHVLSALANRNPNAILAIHAAAVSGTGTLDSHIRVPTALHSYDLTDEVALLVRLQKGADQVSKFLMGQFSANAQKRIRAYNRGTVPSAFLKQLLLRELNRVIQGGRLIYKPELFPQVTDRTRAMIERHHERSDPSGLNRLLLHEAYPREITRCEAVEHIERLKPVARTRNSWPVRGSLYKSINDNTQEFLRQLDLNSDAGPDSDLIHVRPGPAKYVALDEIDMIRRCRSNSQLLTAGMRYSGANACAVLHHKFYFYLWQQVIMLAGLSPASYKDWFNLIKAKLMKEHGGRPELDPVLRPLGFHKAHSERAQANPDWVDTYIRDGIWSKLENAVKTIAKHDPDPPDSENPRSAALRRYSLFNDGEFTHCSLTPHALIEAIEARGFKVPEAPTDIERLNQLLAGDSLNEKIKQAPLCEESKWLIEHVTSLSDSERIRLNRLILENAFFLTKNCSSMSRIHNFAQWARCGEGELKVSIDCQPETSLFPTRRG